LDDPQFAELAAELLLPLLQGMEYLKMK